MNNLSLLVSVFLVLFTSEFAIGQTWNTYNYDSLQFSIKSPELLIQKTTESVTDLGVQVVRSFGLKPKNKENLIYQVIVLQYPDDSFPLDSTDLKTSVLESLVNDTSNQEGSDLIYSQTTGLQGVKGIQWRIHSKGQIIMYRIMM